LGDSVEKIKYMKNKVKNILSLFDGISCGQIALNNLGIKYENYFASEIDKYAIQVTQKNFPSTIQLGDINNWKNWDIDWKNIDLIQGGSPCFVAGTRVITINSIKNIEDVVIGDMVLTHLGNYKKVLRVGGKPLERVLSIKAQGISDTKVTEEHPYYVRSVKRVWDSVRRTSVRNFSEPFWKPANELTKGDFIGLPIISTEINPLEITKEEAFIIGRYIADGHTRKDFRTSENRPNSRHWQVILSVGSQKLESFKQNISQNSYSCYKHSKSVFRCVFSSKRLVDIVEQNCGSGAINKHISKTLLNLPISLLEEILRGYISGDGSLKGDEYHSNTISPLLYSDLVLAVAKVYKTGSSQGFRKTKDTHIIEGRVVNQNDTYDFSFRKNVKKQCHYEVIDNIIWFPIKKVIDTNTCSRVYNLEVADDNSYTANNAIVHNCQGFSFSGKQLNFEDPRSKLFFVFVDILNHVKKLNPNVLFLLENVVMKKEYENVITEALDVNSVMINSTLVSAQNRKRLYWANFEIFQPNDKGITWGDVREHGVNTQSYYYTEKAMQWLARVSQKKNKTLTIHADTDKMQMLEASHCKKYSNQRFFGIVDFPSDAQTVAAMRGRYLVGGKRQDGKQETKGLTKQYVEFRYDGKTNALTTVRKDNIVVPFTLPNRIPTDEFFFRYITPLECERLQNVPDNFTLGISNTQRYRTLGNGWTIGVIEHIYSFLKD